MNIDFLSFNACFALSSKKLAHIHLEAEVPLEMWYRK